MSYTQRRSGESNLAGGLTGPNRPSGVSQRATLLYPKGSQPVYIRDPRKPGKAVGVGATIDESGRTVYIKIVSEADHLFRRTDSWGFDAALPAKLEALNVRTIRIITTDTHVCEEAPFSVLRAKGRTEDLGWGKQIFLQRRYFYRRDAAQLCLLEETAA